MLVEHIVAYLAICPPGCLVISLDMYVVMYPWLYIEGLVLSRERNICIELLGEELGEGGALGIFAVHQEDAR